MSMLLRSLKESGKVYYMLMQCNSVLGQAEEQKTYCL